MRFQLANVDMAHHFLPVRYQQPANAPGSIPLDIEPRHGYSGVLGEFAAATA